MASSSTTRWRVACDTCDASAWIGAAASGFDAWCESCQLAQTTARVPDAESLCTRCGAELPRAPRFVELWGMLQHLDAVLAAWAGDAAPLATLLPERPVFITDLTPPELQPGDAPALRDALAAVARGDWRAALRAATDGSNARAHAARAIAHERLGESAAAIAAWGDVLAVGENERARLARGALLARTGRLAEGTADLARAGGSFPARWDRAASLVLRALSDAAGAPDAGLIARARAEAGEPSAYWSDPTIGRLQWTQLVARVSGAGRDLSAGDRALLRHAESQLEHDTFWDRAMLLVGWVRAGATDGAARIAGPLVREQLGALFAEPALRGEPLADVAGALASARDAAAAADPAAARQLLTPALDRADLRRFRIPCARCRKGSIGVEETREFITGES